MSRKTVKVEMPRVIDDVVLLFERIVARNDGVLPAVPQSTIYIALGALVGLAVPAVIGGSAGTPPALPPGTHKIPEDIALTMRTLYPSIKRNYLDLVALRGLLQSTSNNIQTQLGLAAGQTLVSTGTARNLISRASKVLLGVHAGVENELETYGFTVVVGTASGPNPPTPPP